MGDWRESGEGWKERDCRERYTRDFITFILQLLCLHPSLWDGEETVSFASHPLQFAGGSQSTRFCLRWSLDVDCLILNIILLPEENRKLEIDV